MARKTILRGEGITKTFVQGSKEINVLRGVNLDVKVGEMVALVGASGEGKSTLLHILGLLERADDGYLTIGGNFVGKMDDRAATALRRNKIGFVYQGHHLLPEFSALENVALPLIIDGKPKKAALEKAGELLFSFGLDDRKLHRPAQLSGGQCQRVAIARALANDPLILLADEPTGNLDPASASRVIDILKNQVHSRGLASIIATHNTELANEMDKTLIIKDGKLV